MKNGHVYEGWEVGRSNATPIKLFSVDFYDLKSISFKFSNDIFITFWNARSSFLMSVGKMNISLLFRPSDSEVLGQTYHFFNENKKWQLVFVDLPVIKVKLYGKQLDTQFVWIEEMCLSDYKQPVSSLKMHFEQTVQKVLESLNHLIKKKQPDKQQKTFFKQKFNFLRLSRLKTKFRTIILWNRRSVKILIRLQKNWYVLHSVLE